MSDDLSGATPMRNSDFRALLATPRQAYKQQKQKTPKQSRSSEEGEKKPKFKKPPPKPRPGKPATEEKQEGPSYRDRAKERREGVAVEYADAEQDLAARGLGPVPLQNLSIEQSKFLGGDIAHTHLVKGLDYALLQQERQKLEADKAKAAADAAAAAKAAAMLPRGLQKEQMQFQTRQGRAVYDALFKPPPNTRSLVREMFQPRRTGFVFEFAEGSSDVPTTLRRSKADCPPPQDLVSAGGDSGVLDRISRIIAYLRESGGSRGSKKAERDSSYIHSILAGVNPAAPGDSQVHGQLVMKGQAAAAAAAPAGAAAKPGVAAPPPAAADDDNDIFGEAGTDYVPEIPNKKQTKEARRPDGGYFEGQEHVAELQQPPAAAAAAGGGQDVDMDIEEGELPGRSRAAAAAAQHQQPDQFGYPGQQAGHPGGYYGQQQQQQQQYQQGDWQQQGYPGPQQYDQYGQAQQQQYGGYGQQYPQPPAAEEPVPKWRVAKKPAQELKGFADEAYAEFFPSMLEMGVAEDDDEAEKPVKPGEDAAGAAAGGGGGGRGGGRGGRRGAGAGAGGGMDDMEKKMNQKLGKDLHQIQGFFKEKGWGQEAFKKQDKLDAVAATPARKRIRL